MAGLLGRKDEDGSFAVSVEPINRWQALVKMARLKRQARQQQEAALRSGKGPILGTELPEWGY